MIADRPPRIYYHHLSARPWIFPDVFVVEPF